MILLGCETAKEHWWSRIAATHIAMEQQSREDMVLFFFFIVFGFFSVSVAASTKKKLSVKCDASVLCI